MVGEASRRAWNLAHDLVRFVHTCPAWVGSDGFPLSWGHFVTGNRALSHIDGRDFIASARAARMAQIADGKEFQKAIEAEERMIGIR